jgi:hypothetical protein
MSGNEWDGAPPGDDSWSGYGRAGEPAAGPQPPAAIGPPASASEPWYANRPSVVAHPNWYQPVPLAPRRRRGRVLAAAGAVAVVIIGAVAATVILSPKPGSRAAAAPKSGSHPSSSTHARSSNAAHAGSRLTAAQAVRIASRRSARLRSVSATLTETVSGATSATITANAKEQNSPLRISENIVAVNADGSSTPISLIVTATTCYLKLSESSLGTIPAALANKWIAVPIAKLGPAGSLLKLIRSTENENPVSQTQLLVAAGHLRDVGRQTIDGVSTTEYTGWFRPSVAIKHLAPSLRDALTPALKLINGRINVSTWIDGQHQIRKLTEVEHLASSTVRIVCTLSGFNQPVDIALPPPSQVVTLPASALAGA